MTGRLFFCIILVILLAPRARAQVIDAVQPAGKDAFRTLEIQRNESLMLAVRAPAASPDIDVTYYRLDLKLSTPPLAPFLRGAVTMSARSLADTLGHVTLDLSTIMTVDSVLIAGARVPFHRSPDQIIIDLDRRYPSGQILSLAVFYGGVPTTSGFGSFSFSSHNGTPWVWSLSEPYGARDWWPCKDHPSDKADSADIFVTCDARLIAGSNGILAGVTLNGNGTATYHWMERYPIATYLISIAVTNYVQAVDWFPYSPTDSMMVLHYVLPEQLPVVRSDLKKTVAMLRIFSELYGLYPFIREKYGHCSFGWGGAMEHQTMSSMTTYDEYVVAHELAHQWFGDMITMRSWPDIWLNEGFATYSETLYAERMYGEEAYRMYVAGILEGAKRASGTVSVEDTASVNALFDSRLVYDKGGAVLHMLRHVLGDSVFFRAMHAYAADPALRYRTASTADFRSVCEQVSGRSLGFFFDQWIYGRSYPAYRYGWTAARDTGGASVSLRIEQRTGTASPLFFTMPIDIRCSAGTWDTTLVRTNDAADQVITFHVSRVPSRVVIDPDHWILRDVVNLNDLPPLPAAMRLDQNYPNPFNPGTIIPFELPGRAHVSLKIFSITGQEVVTLIDGRREAGRYEVEWDGSGPKGRVAAGVYFYRLATADGTIIKKMIVLK